MVSGAGRSFVWNGENLPTSLTSGGVTESYGYTADSARVKVVRGSTETIFLEGLYEEIEGGAITKYYTLNGAVVAMREHTGSTSTVTRLHGDHLGSVSVATSSSGVATQQEYDPWGQIRPNAAGTPHPISQTRRNYTGQILDDTGLLYYNARYYDPKLGRFLSADSVVPGNPSGGMDGVAITPLTIDVHEGGFLGKLNAESRTGFWFELGREERQQHGSPMGPANPQSLNRYSYVQNNPLKYTDPTGHYLLLDWHSSLVFQQALIDMSAVASNALNGASIDVDGAISSILAAVGAALGSAVVEVIAALTTMFFEALSTDELTQHLIRVLGHMIDVITHYRLRGDPNAVLEFWFNGVRNGGSSDWYLHARIQGKDGVVNFVPLFVYNDTWHNPRSIFQSLRKLVGCELGKECPADIY
ncbi:MAG: RHS repeat-associated core domain-containing protein [Blastochloris sp.]|nr:RHS repeat-associated core domain-containing protein [Blastochloris sp.]